MIQRHLTKRRIRFLIGCILAIGLAAQGYRSLAERTSTSPAAAPVVTLAKPAANEAIAAMAPVSSTPRLSIEELAARDPIGFLESALDRYDRSVRDYTCTFTKQELVLGRMTARQVMDVEFRENPFSVRMKWTKNPDKCSRVLYVADRWIKDKQPYAVVEPGAIAKLFVPYVMRPIHGEDAHKSSRRTIDQFGLRSTLALTLHYCKEAQKQKVGSFKFVGISKVEGRETLVFERRLPYTGENGPWPDRVLVLHMDKELMVPALCLAYADDAKKHLLGEYRTTDVKLNQNLPDSVFTKQGMGLK